MKNFLALFLLLTVNQIVLSQEFRVPKNYELKEKEDYEKYQADFLAGVNWLFKHSVSHDEKKRLKIEKFVTDWVSGSPTVTVELNYEVAPFIRYSDFKVMYMGAWATNAITNDAYGDVLGNTIYSVKAIVDYYLKYNGSLITVKSLEKYVKLKRKNKLESYIKKKLHYD
jgi:hypothetical protein